MGWVACRGSCSRARRLRLFGGSALPLRALMRAVSRSRAGAASPRSRPALRWTDGQTADPQASRRSNSMHTNALRPSFWRRACGCNPQSPIHAHPRLTTTRPDRPPYSCAPLTHPNPPPRHRRRLLSGESGISLIDRFDASEFPTRFGGQIKNFDDEG